ncbi:addiction module protein [Synergistales bacterium]|nr:addiction module protein [Synergistales bacterium]
MSRINGKFITFITGGARSGKSSFAEKLAAEYTDVTYIATADCLDAEMEERIKIHKLRRPHSWQTWEGDITSLPDEIAGMSGALVLDCLTMYLTRRFLAAPESESDDEAAWFAVEREILSSVEKIFTAVNCRLIAVSNEIGLGVVPPYLMGRRFRDIQGRANQLAASVSDEVAFMVSGLPLWVKK